MTDPRRVVPFNVSANATTPLAPRVDAVVEIVCVVDPATAGAYPSTADPVPNALVPPPPPQAAVMAQIKDVPARDFLTNSLHLDLVAIIKC